GHARVPHSGRAEDMEPVALGTEHGSHHDLRAGVIDRPGKAIPPGNDAAGHRRIVEELAGRVPNLDAHSWLSGNGVAQRSVPWGEDGGVGKAALMHAHRR